MLSLVISGSWHCILTSFVVYTIASELKPTITIKAKPVKVILAIKSSHCGSKLSVLSRIAYVNPIAALLKLKSPEVQVHLYWPLKKFWYFILTTKKTRKSLTNQGPITGDTVWRMSALHKRMILWWTQIHVLPHKESSYPKIRLKRPTAFLFSAARCNVFNYIFYYEGIFWTNALI